MPAPHPQRQREARAKLAGLFAHRASVYVIHYACQSLSGQSAASQNSAAPHLAAGDGRAVSALHGSPRVTAIAARNLETGDVTTFSFQAEVERAGLTPMQVLARYDVLERALLDKLFEFLKINRAMRFVHWNMRDASFGFAAIEHRYAVLGGDPVVIADTQKLDLARLVVEIYGTRGDGTRRLEALADRNRLSCTGLLAGVEEAAAFERGEYAAIQRSTIGKVRLIFELLHLVHDRTLRTDASWWTMNVGRVREAVEMFERNPVYALASLALAGLTTGFGIILKWLE